ncbi:MAG: CpaD family pilus assembly protein [Proteobacteria bacterium]|nr:CpaD family pilus assembly protein [Pseudomonadota bacterium]
MSARRPRQGGRGGPLAARLRALALGALAVMLAGCNTTRERLPDSFASVPQDYRQRHPIVVQEAARTVELFVGSGRGEINAAQRADVLSFAGAWRRESTGGVVIEVPTATRNARAAHDATHQVRSLLIAGGIPAHGIRIQPYSPADASTFATLRLNYPRVAASAGPCGLWPHDLGPSSMRDDFKNRPYWNLGCASQRNLAAMVENPADLVQPRGEADAYRARRTTVLEKYRKGESPATTYPNENKGKISDVGQ